MHIGRSLGVIAVLACAATAFSSPTFRRVVPAGVPVDGVDTFDTLQSAIFTGGMDIGAVIQIEPGAQPGSLSAAAMTAAQNDVQSGLTIRGTSGINPEEHYPIQVSENINITIPSVQFENVHLHFGSAGKFVVTGFLFKMLRSQLVGTAEANDGFLRLGGSFALVDGNRFSGVGDQVRILTTNDGSIIRGNEFTQSSTSRNIVYESNGGIHSDIIERNMFIARRGISAVNQVVINGGNLNIIIDSNTFVDLDFAAPAIAANWGVQNLLIRSNRFEVGGSAGSGVIQISGGLDEPNTSFQVVGNDFVLQDGAIALFLGAPSTGAFAGRVEGNRLDGGMGVRAATLGSTLANVDLGGGNQGSLGGNNFRRFTAPATDLSGAIRTSTGAGNVSAEDNLFSVPAELVIWDANDDPSRFNVDGFPSQSGNEAYVSALYSRFLRRTADLSNPNGAGAVVTNLNNKKPAALIAKTIVRSPEALQYVVDTVYLSVLRRAPTAQELAAGVLSLTRRREEDLLVSLLTSAEARGIYGSDRAFETKAYGLLLGRVPSELESTAFNLLAKKSRLRALQSLLRLPEFTTRRVTLVFDDLLHRAPTAEEIKKYRAFDRLKLLQTIAASVEFQTAG